MRIRSSILSFAVLLFLLAPPSSAQSSHFRFAWLSDTHVSGAIGAVSGAIGAVSSTTGAADLTRTVHDLNAMNDIDFVLLSGDITEMGANAELELAKVILDSLNKPYHIIPGNHDTKWSESGATKFPALWGSDKFVFESGGYRFIGLHQGPLMRIGDGHFAPEDLRWLDSVLVHLPDKIQPLFLVTHYPIDSSVDNWYELIDRAKRYNTQAILCGHGHRNNTLNFEGVPGVMGRSNLRAKDMIGGYTIAEINADSVFFSERITGRETKPVWHKLALGTRNYAADTTRYARPDFSVNRKYSQVKVKWTFATDYTIAAAPAVWKEVVVAGNSDGVVYGLSSQDGKERWRFKTGKGIYSTPAMANGKVVFGSADGNIYCLNVTDAKLIWKFSTATPVVATPRIENGVVYLGSSDRKFRAIHLDTGQLKWEFNGVSGFVETKPLIYDGKVIFGAWDTFLYALNLKDGALVWKWTNGNPGVFFSPAACWPVAAYGKVFIVAPDRFMTAIDVATGKTVWRSNHHQVREAIGVSANGQTVYARCMTDTLLAFSSSAATPQLRRLTPCGYGYDIDPAMPVEKNGIVFFGTKNGFVFAVDAKTGAVKWQHRAGVALVNTVAPIDDRRVVITDMDGRVMMMAAE